MTTESPNDDLRTVFVGGTVSFFLAVVIISLLFLPWCVIGMIGLRVAKHYWGKASERGRFPRISMRILALLLGGLCAVQSVVAMVDGIFLYALRLFAAVATVSTEDKSALLAKGIAEFLNEQTHSLIVAVGTLLLLWGALKLLSQKTESNP